MLIDQEARDLSADPTVSVIARAPAGSGKTGQLLLRILRCLARVTRPEAVLATTFTNKAANEMRERVVDALRSASTGTPVESDYDISVRAAALEVLAVDESLEWSLLTNPARLRICTFDTFCGSLAKRLPVMSGLGATSIEEVPVRIYRQASIDLLSQIESPSASDELKLAIAAVMGAAKNRAEDLVPLLSKLLANRDQWMYELINPDVDQMESQIFDAVNEIYQGSIGVLVDNGLFELQGLFNDASGYHEKVQWADGVNQLDMSDLENLPSLSLMLKSILTASGKRKIKSKLTAREGFPAKKGVTAEVNDFMLGWAGNDEILKASLALVNLPQPTFSDKGRELIEHFSTLLRYLLAHLQIAFDQSGKVDFQEVSYRAIEALGIDDSDVGEALLDEDRIEHILVDEMQDTSLGQLYLINRLCAHWEKGEGRTIFLCGDPMQSIYLFRGANVNLFTGIIDNLSLANQDLKLAVLRANFRSAPEIVNWVNDTFAPVIGDKSSQLDGTVCYEVAEAQKDIPGSVRPVGVVGSLDDEAEWVASDIKAKVDNPESDDKTIVVLGRTRKEIGAIAKRLTAHGITFSGQDVDKLTDNRDVGWFVALVRSIWHASDSASWFELLRSPMVGITWSDCVEIGKERNVYSFIYSDEKVSKLSTDGQDRVNNLVSALSQARLSRESGFIDEVMAAWHLLRGPEMISPQSAQDIKSSLNLLQQCTVGGKIEDIHEFDHRLNGLYASPKAGRVQLMTVHKSKGLEFDHVYLMGLGRKQRGAETKLFEWRRLYDGLTVVANPKIASGSDNDELLYKFMGTLNQNELKQEVKRLLYVASTRSKESLTLTGTVVEGGDGAYWPNSGSLFHVLWDHIPGQVEIELATAPIEECKHVPFIKRPVPAASVAVDMKVFAPKRLESLNESILAEATEETYDNIYERAVGTTYHNLIERESKQSAITKAGGANNLTQAIYTMLRRNGCPESLTAKGTGAVITLIEKTLSCPKGRWIISSERTGDSELAVMLKKGGQLSRLVIDRFIERDNEVWIIDYKTSSPSADESYSVWLNRQKERYAQKMDLYQDAIIACGHDKIVRKGLYFPENQCLVEL